MANIERDKSEDLSVEELVNKLKNNINSEDSPSAEDARNKQESMKKKHDDGGDIASMLKRFLPEDSEGDEFELEDTVGADDADEFELETEDSAAALGVYEPFDEQETYEQLEIDSDFDSDETSAEYESFETESEEVAVDDGDEFEFAEEDVADIGDEDSEFEFSEPDIFDIPEQTLGANSSLLAGFASVLEETYSPEESRAIAAAVLEANGLNAQAGEPSQAPQPDVSTGETAPADDTAEADSSIDASAQSGVSFGEAELEDIPTFEGLMTENLSDFEEIIPPDVAALEGDFSALSEEDELIEELADTSDAEAAEPEQEASAAQLYTFDTPSVPQPEEEYYAFEEKNPLAFDMDDEGPAVPDESAFADVDNAEAIEAQMMVENKFSDLSEDELNLMVALGYEDRIADEDGKKKAEEITEKNSSEIVDPIDVDNSFAFDGVELSSHDQFRAVRNRYKQEHKVMKFRLLGTLILTVALLFFETFTALSDAGSITLGGALNINRYPVVNIMISLQLVVLACSLSWHRLLVGLRDAVMFRPSPISVSSVAILCCVIYDVIMAIIAPDMGLRTYNLTAAVFLLALVLNDYMNLSREIRAFNTVSTRKPKFALTSDGVSPHLHDEAVVNAISGGDAIPAWEKNFEVKSVNFIENYFRRTNVSSFSSRSLNLIIFPFVALAIILGIISFMSNGNAVAAFNIAILTVVVGMPLSSVLIMCYPIFAAVRYLFKKDATIVGDPSVEEYSDATSVVFCDKDVFPMASTIMRGIKLYDNEDASIYYVLSNLTKFYSRVGGPLKEVLAQTTSEVHSPDSAELVRVEEDGVEAVIDGNINMLAGQRYFMERNGIWVDNDPDDVRMAGEGVSALFVVLDGKLCAKLYVQYDIDHSFEDIINSLASENIDTYIKTTDPCIDDALLASKLRISRFPAKIIKRELAEPSDGSIESADSGIVSRSALGGLADAVVLCNRIKRVRKTSRSICVVSSVIGVLVMVFLAMFSSAPDILSIYTVIYQIFWLIPMMLFTKLFIK